jgi:hypothetical protein
MTWPIAFNPSSSLIASILPLLEEAGNPESAKDSVRYLRSSRVDHRNDLFHIPKCICDACCHGEGDFERLMDAAEVVKHEVERERVAVIFQLL